MTVNDSSKKVLERVKEKPFEIVLLFDNLIPERAAGEAPAGIVG